MQSPRKNQYHLEGPASYRYTRESVHTVDGVNDTDEYYETEKAMKSVGMSEQQIDSVFRVIAGVLHLGNIEFDNSEPAAPHAANLKKASEVFGLNTKQLSDALQFRTISAGGDVKRIPANQETACYTRDAFAKAIYFRVFNWIVQRINESIHSDSSNITIGVLDIYGFEIFPINSFEQLLINYANEKLQQIFIELTLKQEQEEYLREGITWEPINYFNNKPCVDLIENQKPPGILKIMDEECIFPKGTDRSLIEKLAVQLKTREGFALVKTKTGGADSQNQFVVRHYAGDVVYDVIGFLDKSKDTLFKDLKLLMLNSGNPFFQQLFEPDREYLDDRKRPPTAGHQFVVQMKALSDKLMSCEAHYIRCIRPNGNKRASNWDAEMSGHQVRYLGLLENVRVRRAGFAFRTEHERFERRYKMICKATWPFSERGKSGPEIAVDILKSQEFKPPQDFQLGRTKVFIKDPRTLFRLEEQREIAIERLIVKIQTRWRGYIARVKFERLKAIVMIQRVFRSYLTRRLYLKMRTRVAIAYNSKKERNRATVFRDYLGDYLDLSADPLVRKAIRGKDNQDSKIVFADAAVQIAGAKSLRTHVIFVITDLASYLFGAAKFKLVRRIAHEEIAKISVSERADHFFVIHSKDPKSAFDVVVESHKKSEILLRLLNQFAKRNLNVEIEISNKLTFAMKKKNFTILFEAGNNDRATLEANPKTMQITVHSPRGIAGEAPQNQPALVHDHGKHCTAPALLHRTNFAQIWIMEARKENRWTKSKKPKSLWSLQKAKADAAALSNNVVFRGAFYYPFFCYLNQ